MSGSHTATLLVRDLQCAPFDRGAWDVFAQRLGTALHGAVVLGTVHLPTGTPTRIEQTGLSDQAIDAYRQHYFRISPWRAWMMQAREGTVAAGAAVNPLPPAVNEKTEFYTDFMRPNDLHYGISARILRDPTHVTDLAILRSRAAGEPDAEAQRLMACLMPHVRRSLRVRRLLDAASLPPSRLLMPALGVLLVDRDGRLLLANQAALDRLSDSDGLTVRRGALAPTCEAAVPRLRHLIRRAVDGAGTLRIRGGGDMLLPRADLPPLRVTITATPPTGDAFGHVAPAALLLLREPPAAPVFRKPTQGW